MGNFDIYLPIAEMPVNIITILILGGIGGFLAGMFGIGGGFLMIPLLIFIGIPPAIAVATSSNQIIAASVSGFLAHWRRGNVDIKMGLYLLGGGFVGSTLGVWLFTILEEIGQIDLVISVCYAVFLGSIGTLMAVESFRTILNLRRGAAPDSTKKKGWVKNLNLPFVIRFPRSSLRISAIIPVATGVLSGVLVALMGIGGGFLMVPAMIYIIGMPVSIVIGTSLFQIIFTTSNVTFLHAVNTQTVDIVLAFLLLIGSVIGAQFGTKMGLKLPAERMRAIMAVMVLLVAFKMALGLLTEPSSLYTIVETE